jgi:uncharacterized membrane protein
MRKASYAAASILLMMLHSPLARADEGLPAPIVVVTNVLQLSPDQTGALITMIQTRDAALHPIAARLRADHEALGKLLESPAPDAAAVGGLLIEIHAAEKQAGAVAQDAAAGFDSILTDEQRQRLQFVRQAAQAQPAVPAFKAVGLL